MSIRDTARESAHRRIEKQINSMRDYLISEGYDARSDIFINRDGSIDAEVRVVTIPASTNTTDIVLAMSSSAYPIADVWGSFEFVRPVRKHEHKSGLLEKERGAGYVSRMTMNYRRIYSHTIVRGRRRIKRPGQTILAGLFVGASKMDKNAKKLKRRKAEMVAYRLHWNYDVKQPELP